MIEIKNISKTFITPTKDVEALKDVSIKIDDGDIFGIIGMSGAGKSTLVRCINMLERPTSGQIIIDGVCLTDKTEKQLRQIRRSIAMVFQNFNLLMQANCLENVMFPLELIGENKNKSKQRAFELLDIVGLADKAYEYPSRLSGGQKQRVAIARALASNPKVLLCDEATSALDPATTNSILELIRDINEKLKITVIVITHQMSVVESICKKVAILDKGRVAESGLVSKVFSSPKSKAAKQLVFPENDSASMIVSGSEERIIRVVFNGAKSASQPLIASLAIDKGIAANIIYASIKNINSKAYGSLLLGVKDEEQMKETIEYLSSVSNVSAKEFSIDE